MSDLEGTKAQKEALEHVTQEPSSADRARLWAGLNRYLGAEARRAHRAAEEERRRERESTDDRSE